VGRARKETEVQDPEGGPRYWHVLKEALLLVLGIGAIAVAFADTLEAKVEVVAAIFALVAAWYIGYVVGSWRHRPGRPPRGARAP
jgi:membrane protein YdbS with pleckstrin-like domain